MSGNIGIAALEGYIGFLGRDTAAYTYAVRYRYINGHSAGMCEADAAEGAVVAASDTDTAVVFYGHGQIAASADIKERILGYEYSVVENCIFAGEEKRYAASAAEFYYRSVSCFEANVFKCDLRLNVLLNNDLGLKFAVRGADDLYLCVVAKISARSWPMILTLPPVIYIALYF